MNISIAVALSGIALLGGCRTEKAQVGEYRFGIEGAPLQYQGDAVAVVMTGGQVPVHVYCSGGLPTNQVILACTSPDRTIIAMPNPCEFADTERYARLLCHEMGHVNGWTHGR